MVFKVQINVGETIEEIQERCIKDLKDIKSGKRPEVINQLSFLTWDLFMTILTPAGKAMMEDFKRQEADPDYVPWKYSHESAYPPDDGLPTPEQLKAIDNLAPQDKPTTPISDLFND